MHKGKYDGTIDKTRYIKPFSKCTSYNKQDNQGFILTQRCPVTFRGKFKLFHPAAFIYLIIQETLAILTAVRKYGEKIKLNFAPFVGGARGLGRQEPGCRRDHQATHWTHQSYSCGRFINSRLCNLTHYISAPFITSSVQKSRSHRFAVNFQPSNDFRQITPYFLVTTKTKRWQTTVPGGLSNLRESDTSRAILFIVSSDSAVLVRSFPLIYRYSIIDRLFL